MLKLASNCLASRTDILKIVNREHGDSRDKSAFADAKLIPPVEVFHLRNLYLLDTHEKKVNLGIGAYRTEENNPFVLPIVKKCEVEVANNTKLNHEYLPILGNAEYTKVATELLLGKDCKAIKENRTVSAQTVAGTGALRIGSEFLCQCLKKRICLLSDPSYGNHINILRQAGFKQFRKYPYWNQKKKKLDIARLLAGLCNAPEGAVVLLQASGHNPTGLDPTMKQWQQISEVVKMRHLFPFFDAAYIGFSSGNPDLDAWGIRYFIKQGHETLIAQSFSKNMGLYNERIGNLIAVLNNKSYAPAVASEFTRLIRVDYSNPPAYGSRIIARVLGNKSNRRKWLKTLKMMANRVKKMRKELAEKLVELETPGTWDHITQGHGMFAYLGLTPKQCEKLRVDKHIYLLSSSRINICGLNSKNIDYVAKSINEVVTGSDSKNRKKKSCKE
ncbi:aspartate aminotransferase, cytoplasmic [Drosophila mojavensis]|uniref:Aspartate aminotransferase n=1 Tax=Drosophila mojavensis TaxID=7230 RepID=B4KZL9_DROMO|nr:aspartate aminotransferase, cytoplasmic [Drosophila mojavensis]EDW18975.2 uncharacterized protein Dmoj_GI13534 [Drosophila mojavensis]